MFGAGIEVDDGLEDVEVIAEDIARETDREVTCHGQTWRKNDQCVGDQRVTHGERQQKKHVFKLPDKREVPEFDYFLAMFPVELVHEVCDIMSIRTDSSVDVGEFWLFMGCLMYMLCHSEEGPMGNYWHDKQRDGEAGPVHNLGQYGMSKSRFQKLKDAFRLPTYGNNNDPFDPIRKFADAWNQHITSIFEPGEVMVVDESMALWKGMKMPGLLACV